MKILGISAFYHDSAATIIEDQNIIAAAQEERFTRIKHDFSFPVHAVRFCLGSAKCSIDELDAVVFYDKPFIKFERLVETYYAFAPKGFASFCKSMPVWIKEKIFQKNNIIRELEQIEKFDQKRLKLLFPEHHLSHAGSAFYPSPFNEAAILTIDGVGEWATATMCYGKGNAITNLKELRFPHSVGLLYSAFTYFLGFKVNSGEYKLMGLAPYGNHDSDEVTHFVRKIKEELVDIKEDGSIWLNQKYFNYAVGLKMIDEKRWKILFGFKRRQPEEEIEGHHTNLSLAIQIVTEEIVLKMARELKSITGSDNLCLAGGVALNCVANGKIVKEEIFKNIFIQPAAGDAGGSLGASLAAYHIYFGKNRVVSVQQDTMQGALLGPEYDDKEIEKLLTKYHINYTKYDQFDRLAEVASELLDQASIIGWFQGRMEFGPRALGNRSIIGDARNPEIQKMINQKIKFREGFRPFAPSVLKEDVSEYFLLDQESPYMLLVAELTEKYRKKLPDHYESLSLREKLNTMRSELQSITHVDFSARVHTVDKDTNFRYWKLIETFKKKTGVGVIVNTSFNVRGEPVVNTPEEAFHCFMRTEMDCLVIGNYLIKKNDNMTDNTNHLKNEYNENFRAPLKTQMLI